MRNGTTQCPSQRPLVREKKTNGSRRLKTMMISTRLSVASSTSYTLQARSRNTVKPTVIAMAAVTSWVRIAMEHKNFNLFGGRVPEGARILGRDLGGDSNFTCDLFWRIGAGRKRQHVGGFVFSAETAVQGLHLRARSNK